MSVNIYTVMFLLILSGHGMYLVDDAHQYESHQVILCCALHRDADAIIGYNLIAPSVFFALDT